MNDILWFMLVMALPFGAGSSLVRFLFTGDPWTLLYCMIMTITFIVYLVCGA
jgi:hypothetical protein